MDIGTSSTDDCFSNELGSIIQDNQSEIDLVKDLLQGCVGMDTNAFMAVSILRNSSVFIQMSQMLTTVSL